MGSDADEVYSIDRESFQMACQVLLNREAACKMQARAGFLLDRLQELENTSTKVIGLNDSRLSDAISESMLDLNYVLDPLASTSSFRLAPLRRYQKAGFDIDLKQRPNLESFEE